VSGGAEGMDEPISDGRDGLGRFAAGNRFDGPSRTGSRPAAVLALRAWVRRRRALAPAGG
jgi:hypothetical protein